ncbi:MAG: hypothetical protein K9W43_10210 [Candidatus Thorarchaeota archaeon]|nr:hypothetical protein [Candidatus Thorarchaeota archaeon]
MTLPKINLKSQFTRRVVTSVFVAFILAISLGAAIVLLVPESTVPTFALTETSAIPNTVGYSNTSIPSSAPFDGALFQESPFRGNESWTRDVVTLVYPYTTYTEYSLTPENDGLHIKADNYLFTFYRKCNIVLTNITSLTFSVDFENIDGFTQVRMDLLLMSGDSILELPLNSTSFKSIWYFAAVNMTGSSSKTLTIDVPLDEVRRATDQWIIEGQFRFDIFAHKPIEVVIKQARALASYDTQLFPVRVTPKSTENVPLLSSPFFPQLGYNIALNISPFGEDNFSLVLFKKPDSQFYLPVGQYSGWGGWYLTARKNWTTPLVFEVRQDSLTAVEFKLPTVRLDVSISPNVPFVFLDVYFKDSKSSILITDSIGRDYTYHYYSDLVNLVTSSTVSLYIPAYSGIISFECRLLNSGYMEFEDRLNYSQYISGKSNLHLTVKLPFLEVGGFSVSTGAMIITALYGSIFLVSLILLWRNSDVRLLKRIKEDPRVLPIILLFFSIVTPWFHVIVHQGSSSSALAVNYLGFPGPTFIFAWSQGSSILWINMPLWFYLPYVVVTLWIPLFALIHSLRTDEPWRISPLLIYAMVAPFGAVSMITPYLILVGSHITLLIGIYLAVLPLLIWVGRHIHKRYRMRQNQV